MGFRLLLELGRETSFVGLSAVGRAGRVGAFGLGEMKTQRCDKNDFLSHPAFTPNFGWEAVACAKHRSQHHWVLFVCHHSHAAFP